MEERKTIAEIMAPPLKPTKIRTFVNFIDIVRDTWNMVHPGKAQFVHAYPVQDSKNLESLKPPLIDYLIVDKAPTKMGGEQEIKPRIRRVIEDKYNPQEVHNIFGQRFTYLIDFGIWESNWNKVEELQMVFEDFMLIFTGTFKELGVSEMIYLKGTEDIPRNAVWRTDLVSSHVLFRVDIEHTLDYPSQVIERIKVKLSKLGGEQING
jgi:hypothetical protein